MAAHNSLVEVSLYSRLLHDLQKVHEDVFTQRELALTLARVASRTRHEGISFLAKTLPRLGKALDRALTGTPLNSSELGFAPQPGSKLPKFLGGLFNKVLSPDGMVLQDPCVRCVRAIRDATYILYKYELPYSDEQEQKVLDKFLKTEEDLVTLSPKLQQMQSIVDSIDTHQRRRLTAVDPIVIIREARILLARVFSSFDFTDIVPRHGPGAVATRQQLWEKYQWSNVSSRIAVHYPLDAYFFASAGHVCDHLQGLNDLGSEDLPARFILVPKDSRGPRGISCEPVENQWVQQGIMRRLVDHIETHPLTKWNVRFTDQGPNQRAAIQGSRRGDYATLDLAEASDRISLDLVRLLYPEHVFNVLEAVRSLSTTLPNGQNIVLRKFAPMGSALCFPILALTIWAILTAGVHDTDARESTYVYGDDVIVRGDKALEAIERLELFGLKVNTDKSCISGLFRESCGEDAFKGVSVTPLRLRTVWSSKPSPEVYTSWIAYANSFYDRQYYSCYDFVVGLLGRVYEQVPSYEMFPRGDVPCLRVVPESKIGRAHV